VAVEVLVILIRVRKQVVQVVQAAAVQELQAELAVAQLLQGKEILAELVTELLVAEMAVAAAVKVLQAVMVF
jgi:hypothetical protein